MHLTDSGVGRRNRGKVHIRGAVASFGGVSPVVAATDAAATREGVGFGYVTSDGHWGLCGRRRRVGDPDGPSVVLINELRAVEMCLTDPGSSRPPSLLLVDSLDAIQWLEAWRGGDVSMPDGYDLRTRVQRSSSSADHARRSRPTLVRLAELMAGRRDIRVEHVPAHRGHPLNEAADSLAKIGCRRIGEKFDAGQRATGIAEAFLSTWHQGGYEHT